MRLKADMFKRLIWGGVLCSLLIPAVLHGAEGDILSKFHPYITVEEQYNDNIYLTRDNKKDDFITTVSPGMKFSTMDKVSESSGIDLDYRLGMVFYAREHEKNYMSHKGNLLARYKTKEHLSFSVRDSFTRSDEPREQQYFTEPRDSQYVLATQNQRNIYWRNVVAPNVEYQFGREDKVGINYRNNLYRTQVEGGDNSREDDVNPYVTYWFNKNNGITLEYGYTRGAFDVSQDLTGHRGKFRYTYRFTPNSSTFAEYDFSRKNFDSPKPNSGMPKSNYDIHEGYLGLEHAFSRIFKASGQVGYYQQNPEVGSNNSGVSYKAEMSLNEKLTTFKLNLQGGYTEDYFTAENLGFNKYHRLTASVKHNLTRHFSVGAFGNAELADFTGQNRQDWIYGIGGTASYTPLKWLSMSLEYKYSQRNSDIDTYDYAENRVSFRITATY